MELTCGLGRVDEANKGSDVTTVAALGFALSKPDSTIKLSGLLYDREE